MLRIEVEKELKEERNTLLIIYEDNELGRNKNIWLKKGIDNM